MSEHTPHPEQNSPEEAGNDAEKLRERPRIWVGSLADYNNGHLYGEWIDAAVPDRELIASVQRMLAGSRETGAEEYGIFDYDNFGAFRVHEYDRLEKVARIARGIDKHGAAFAAWAELHDGDPSMLDQFEDAYLGEYDSPAAWAHEMLENSGVVASVNEAVPEALQPYVHLDYAGWARDAHLCGDLHFELSNTGGVWIFSIT